MRGSREETVRLASGFRMPLIGLGTHRLAGKECVRAVRTAMSLGYRHIDTAEMYANEEDIGRAIRGHDRAGLFITSKVWRTHLRRRSLIRSCRASLGRLGTPYLDLYLVHWPDRSVPIKETLAAMKELVAQGLVRSIGVSNFGPSLLQEALKASDIPITNDQVEFHPYLYQRELLAFSKRNGVTMTAYCPVAKGTVFRDPVLSEIGVRHGKTASQVSLRWLLQHGLAAIPKSGNPAHMRENMDVFGWRLSAAEMRRMDSLGTSRRLISPAFTGLPYFVLNAAQRALTLARAGSRGRSRA